MEHFKCPKCGDYSFVYDSEFDRWACRKRECLHTQTIYSTGNKEDKRTGKSSEYIQPQTACA